MEMLAEDLILLNYQQLPSALWEDLLRLFQLDCDAQELLALKVRSSLHSKHRHISFVGDPLPRLMQAARGSSAFMWICEEKYCHLEQLRLNGNIC